MSSTPEFHLFLPQMRMTMPDLVDRARTAEAAGFTGMALMDHFAPPLAEQHTMYEAMTTAGWLLASTERLVVSHLVLCDTFRHPAMLARQAVTLDHASGGRFQLGIGWGSVPAEYESFGVEPRTAAARVARLKESLEVIRALWTGEPVDFDGEYHSMKGAVQNPPPIDRIPIIIGGAGKKTLALVAEHADWWNLPIYALDRYDELRSQVGNARVSTQEMVGFVPSEEKRAAIEDLALKRFGPNAFGSSLFIGNGDELTEHFAARREQGVERFYVWFADFAKSDTLEGFGDGVISSF
ncbi:MAG: LLM class flavin-dependent oxidoreductase [Acidimicrobiales bacterium]|nr:LLM class flavin-dependent oxidoreductase [Acidimicrobiales bacterium]